MPTAVLARVVGRAPEFSRGEVAYTNHRAERSRGRRRARRAVERYSGPRLTLAQMRKRRTLSANELGKLAGVAASTVLDIEQREVTPRYGTIRKLADALACRPEDILWPGDPLGLDE